MPFFARRTRQPLWGLALLCLLLQSAPVHALDIQLTGGNWNPIHIFVEIFPGEEKLEGTPPSHIIGNDLAASGHFKTFRESTNSLLVLGDDNQRMTQIRGRGGEYLLTGKVEPDKSGGYSLRFILADALTETIIGDYRISFSADTKRLAAHQVANWVYENITGQAGVFHTKVLYVLRQADSDQNTIRIADYDGYGRQTILSSDNTLISPAWTPDGNGILYVSFEQNKPIIYRQSLLTGERQIVANFKGSNSAPAASPNNRTIAAALTEHGGEQQIYLLADNRKNLMRAANGINTEPAFSPDGKRVAFTSDEGGTPQIYEYHLDKKEVRRLTHGSKYNVSPQYAADGKTFVYIRRDDNGNNVTLQDLAGGRFTALTDIRLADSPSFSPNGNIVIFSNERRKNYLATVAINGKVTVYWSDPEDGEIIDPSWSPIKSDWF